jgi:hypothetical protein
MSIDIRRMDKAALDDLNRRSREWKAGQRQPVADAAAELSEMSPRQIAEIKGLAENATQVEICGTSTPTEVDEVQPPLIQGGTIVADQLDLF